MHAITRNEVTKLRDKKFKGNSPKFTPNPTGISFDFPSLPLNYFRIRQAFKILTEAILLYGDGAPVAHDRFATMDTGERQALIASLNSL